MELIVEDAEFVTLAPAGRAESMLVRDGRIAVIGPAAAVRAAAEPGAGGVMGDGQGDRNYPVASSSAPARRARISPIVRSRLSVSGSGRWAWIW